MTEPVHSIVLFIDSRIRIKERHASNTPFKKPKNKIAVRRRGLGLLQSIDANTKPVKERPVQVT
jgi:hypothetical protein